MKFGLMRDTLEQHVRLRAHAGGDMPLARLVLSIGKCYEGVAFSGRRRAPKMCFENALKHAEVNGLAYAEGYGLSGTLLKGGLVFPVEHAWCVDADGNAVDPTWEDPQSSVYMGVEFSVREVWKRVAYKGTFGMFATGPMGVDDIEFMEIMAPGLIAARPVRMPMAPSDAEENGVPSLEGR